MTHRRSIACASLTLAALGCLRNPSSVDLADIDGDGWTINDDCDDGDPLLGGPEVPFDGVDNDCDASTLDDDGDQDGSPVDEDCDDEDPLGWLPDRPFEGTVDGSSVIGFCDGYCLRTVAGNINLDDTSLVNLDDLRCVPSVRGNLELTDNPGLGSILGLERLSEVGGSIEIDSNPLLTSLEGLEGLATVGGGCGSRTIRVSPPSPTCNSSRR